MVLTAIVWLSQLLRYSNIISNSSIGIGSFLGLSAMVIPSLLVITLPISVFISTLYIYNAMSSDSELIVLKGAGLNKMQLVKPAMIIGGLVCIINYALCFYVMPTTHKEFKIRFNSYKDNYTQALLEPGVFNNSIRGVTIYIADQSEDGTLRNVLVHDTRHPDRPTTLIAEAARIIKNQQYNTTGLELINGNQQHIDDEGNLAILYFSHFTYYPTVAANITERKLDPQDHYIHELFLPADHPAAVKMRNEAHHRFTWPLQALNLVVIAAIAIISNEASRVKNSRKIIMAGVLGTATLIGHFLIMSIIIRKPHLLPMIYCYPVVVFIMALLSCREGGVIEKHHSLSLA